jgi:hypothetical protein
MGGFGKIGGTGYIPNGTEWVFLGWDDSMHPTPEAVDAVPIDAVPVEH